MSDKLNTNEMIEALMDGLGLTREEAVAWLIDDGSIAEADEV